MAGIVLLALGASQPVAAEAPARVLVRVAGDVGVRRDADGPIARVDGATMFPDDAYADTADDSAALLFLHDASIVALGERTAVQAGPYGARSAAYPAEELVVLDRGIVRLDDLASRIGASVEDSVATPNASITLSDALVIVRSDEQGTTVACLRCRSGSVHVMLPASDVGHPAGPLTDRQMLTIHDHVAAISPTTPSDLATFERDGVSTKTSSGVDGTVPGALPR